MLSSRLLIFLPCCLPLHYKKLIFIKPNVVGGIIVGKLFSATFLSELDPPSMKIGIRNTRFYFDLKTDQCNYLSHQALIRLLQDSMWVGSGGRKSAFSQQANPPHICMWGLFAVNWLFTWVRTPTTGEI